MENEQNSVQQTEHEAPKEKKQVFRQKSLERVASPEQLNQYLRVVNVGVWILLGAIIIAIIGGLIWGAVVKMESKTVTAAAVVKNGEVSIYMTENGKNNVSEGMTMHICDKDYIFPETEINAVKLFALTDSAVIDILDTTEDEYAYVARFYADLPNGIHEATIVYASISPLSLLFD